MVMEIAFLDYLQISSVYALSIIPIHLYHKSNKRLDDLSPVLAHFGRVMPTVTD